MMRGVAAGLTAQLVGRDEELALIRGLLDSARQGMSRAVVLCGEAGVGKTMLLGAAGMEACDMQHLRAVGVEAETELAFAGLQRLVHAYLAHAADLPAPQREAIGIAVGREFGRPPDPYLIGLATLNLLAAVASAQPTLVTIDDAQWLDRESLLVLGFVARRLDAEAVAMLFAARAGSDLSPLDGLEVVDVTDLAPGEALDLLQLVVGDRVDQRVAVDVLRSTGGNPLAIRELGTTLTAAQLDGSERLPEPLSVGRRLEEYYASVISQLPSNTRTWLLVAAAESTGDLAAVQSAVELMSLPADSAGPAERIGLVSIGRRLEFRHPLVRAAIYGASTSVDRQAAHLALARSIRKDVDPDRHAVHLAAGVTGPNEQVASELESAAARARRRGGLAARADLLVRAAALTPDPRDASRRLLEAAGAAFAAGSGRHSQAIVDSVALESLDPLDRARCRLLRVRVAAASGTEGASARVSAECLAAAEMSADRDAEFTCTALFDACLGAMVSDRLIEGASVVEIATAAREAVRDDQSVTGLLVRAFAALPIDGYRAAVPMIQRAIDRLLDPATPDEVVLDRHLLGITLCTVTLDHESTLAVAHRVDRIARSTGALGTLDTLLYAWSMTETIWGRLDRAEDLLAEGVQLHTVLARSSREFDIYRHPELAAWRGGDRAPIDELIQATAAAGAWVGHGALVAVCDVARIILELSRGEYAAAKAAGWRLIESDGFAMHTRVLPDLVEAAVRDGDPDTARYAFEMLEARADAAATPFALAGAARAAALVAQDDDVAEAAYLRAIERFGLIDARGELGRSHLVYGEWLRRRRRLLDARRQLEVAHQIFSEMGAHGWAERSRVELAVSGGRARRRSVHTARDLTAQERQIATLAADGLTNAEIGARLYISPQTVDYHLRKVYRKLDIGSRRQLRGRTF